MSKTFISLLAGLGAMFGWGVSDFFANSASDKFGHTKAFFYSQVAGIILIGLVALIAVADFSISASLIPLVLLSSLGYALGYMLFYKGFEIGNVSVIASVINLQQLFIIGISFFVYKQTLTALQVPAIMAVLTGITLVSIDFSDFKQKGVVLAKGVKETVIAAVMFGVIYWPTNEYIVERSDWITSSLYIKVFALLIVLAFCLFKKQNLTIRKKSLNVWVLLALVGVLEAIAVLSIGFGGAYGDYIIVAPISSSLTIVTVALAMIFSKEKITRTQGVGIVVTIAGILLTAI